VKLKEEERDEFRLFLKETKSISENLFGEYERRAAKREENHDVNILLLGVTGHGKTSLLNLLFGEMVGRISKDQSSTTRHVRKYTHPSVDTLHFIDTPVKNVTLSLF